MQCIVFTDSERLAGKYRCSRQDVVFLLHKNLDHSVEAEFQILDAADYREELGSAPIWANYKEILADFMAGMGIGPSPQLSLFIIGGDDVVPMPKIANPINGQEMLQVDLLYCFEGNCIEVLDPAEAICNVGRLPLESGSLPSTLAEDLQSYFNLANMLLATGIDVHKVIMTTTQSWLPASTDMVKGLPMELPVAIADATCGDMYVSPRLATDDDYVLRHYQNDLKMADMLMFNLHGSDARGYSSFYGEGLNGHNTPEAFTCEMLKYSGARILNTVACFGGRYTGYSRKDSMLMSSMYGGGVVLYAGSCTSALGRTGRLHNEAQDALMPSGYSESFMKLYSLYLFKGISAGEAFLKAKCDYFNLCKELDGEDCAMATVLMFNLFGHPLLRVNPNADVMQEARGIKGIRPVDAAGETVYKTVYSSGNRMSGSILEQIRGAVDRNLSIIRSTVESHLYKYWGLASKDLAKIEEIYINSASTGFRFEYVTKGEIIEKRSWAYVDKMGNVKNVVHFK